MSKIYPAGRFTFETDVQDLADSRFQGIVSIMEDTGNVVKESIYTCPEVRGTAAEAQADADRYAAVRQQQQASNK
jgi:hypothetical protein